MTNGMARCIQEIEGPVTEEVICVEAANFQAARLERDLPDYPTPRIAVEHNGIPMPWPPRPRSCTDARSYDEVGAWWKLGDIPDVVEVVVRPNDGFDIGATDVEAAIIRFKYRRHIRPHRNYSSCLDERDDSGGVILPVRANAEVEDYVPTAMRY